MHRKPNRGHGEQVIALINTKHVFPFSDACIYFGDHPPNRRAYRVHLRRGISIKTATGAELPDV
jgi:hypothetical protein